ncbi:MAG TPA: hypothetical protein PKD24_00120 [Pyrinomonadaceae bacterium]|nr:hypothetical protein [Pyrinomonadaceae bacterium]HMP64441.1 hypothetical protein [Pyrinomonadaceae bacterium]
MFAFVLSAVLLAAPLFGQSEPQDAENIIESVYLARSNAAGEPGDPVEGFLTTDVPIHCVVYLSRAEPVAVRLNFVAVKVPGVRAETHVVSASYTTKEGETRVFFSGRPHNRWHAGRYRADIFVGEKLERSVEFDITSPPAKPAVNALTGPKPPTRRQAPRRRP